VLQQSVFKPFISVIITAFNRDTFLKDAIESALKQTLDKKVYEVIVVKNFDWEFDDVYSSRGVKIIKDQSPNLGEMMVHAVDKSLGEIIAFLNDDDMFMSEKLRIVYKIFKQNPDLIFYHHSAEVIDSKGRRVVKKGFHVRKLNSLIITKSSQGLLNVIKIFTNSRYGDSQIAVRRELIEKTRSI